MMRKRIPWKSDFGVLSFGRREVNYVNPREKYSTYFKSGLSLSLFYLHKTQSLQLLLPFFKCKLNSVQPQKAAANKRIHPGTTPYLSPSNSHSDRGLQGPLKSTVLHSAVVPQPFLLALPASEEKGKDLEEQSLSAQELQLHQEH